jgi:hypothetical protein
VSSLRCLVAIGRGDGSAVLRCPPATVRTRPLAVRAAAHSAIAATAPAPADPSYLAATVPAATNPLHLTATGLPATDPLRLTPTGLAATDPLRLTPTGLAATDPLLLTSTPVARVGGGRFNGWRGYRKRGGSRLGWGDRHVPPRRAPGR